MKKEKENLFTWNDTIQKMNDDRMDQLLNECDDSFKDRTKRVSKLTNLVISKSHKLTDEQLNHLIEWFEGLE